MKTFPVEVDTTVKISELVEVLIDVMLIGAVAPKAFFEKSAVRVLSKVIFNRFRLDTKKFFIGDNSQICSGQKNR